MFECSEEVLSELGILLFAFFLGRPMIRRYILELNLVIFVHLVIEFYIGRDNANDEGNEPLYRVYKVGPVKLYTVESILRLLLHFIGTGSGDLEGIQRNVWRPISSHSDSEG